MADRRERTKTLLIAAVGAGISCSAIAEPPPFLPPSLQRVVEAARERNARPEPHQRSAEIDDLRAISEGDITLGEVIEQLGDENLEARDRASATLADVAMWDEDVLAAACRLPGICAETRERLRVAMFDRFVNSPKPAVGISMRPESRSGIAIEAVQAGFPSTRVLRAGDEILKIGEVDFRPNPRDQYLLQVTVASYDPGDVVDMLVLRNNEEIEVQVELGSFEALGPRAGARNLALYRRAFEMRMERFGIDLFTGQALAAPISRFDWERASRRPVRQSAANDMLAGGAPSVIPGRPSGGLRVNDNLRAVRAERARDDVKRDALDPAIDAALMQIRQIEADIESLRAKLNDPRTTREERGTLTARMADLAKLRQALVNTINNR